MGLTVEPRPEFKTFEAPTNKMKISFYERPRYRGRQDRAPMSHSSQDSIRDELEALPCSCLRRPQPLCRTHLPQHGPSLQIQHAPLGDRAFPL